MMNLDSIDPNFAAGLADIVTADADLGHGLRLLSTPGHTPGHASVEVTSGDERMVITGDLLHHPVQMANPKWAETADYDVALAVETRARLPRRALPARTRVAGTHFPTAPVGRIEAHAACWRFAPEE